jgi:hypothetical protein
MGALWIVYVAFILFMLAAMWKVLTKAGQRGCTCIIPLYNVYIILKIASKPGKSGGFAVGMLFLPFIFFPILGFGSATYQG